MSTSSCCPLLIQIIVVDRLRHQNLIPSLPRDLFTMNLANSFRSNDAVIYFGFPATASVFDAMRHVVQNLESRSCNVTSDPIRLTKIRPDQTYKNFTMD